MAAPAALVALKAIADVASLVSSVKNIFDDSHQQIEQKLDAVLTQLQGLRNTIVTGISEILEAIDGISRQIDEDLAFDNINLAEVAFYNDLAVFDDKQAAMTKSFDAANRLVKESDIVFASAFMYVVNFRHAVMKDFDSQYICKAQFRTEFQGYISRLEGWINQLNDQITQSHTVVATLIKEDLNDDDGTGPLLKPLIIRFWLVDHLRNGVVVKSFQGPLNDTSQSTRQQLVKQANQSRKTEIDADRQELGVVAMEETLAAWKQPFTIKLALALIEQVLNRPTLPIDFNPNGMMIDGRILPANLDLRSTLMELLVSREFQTRVPAVVRGLVNDGDERIVRFAHRRLFDRDATDEEVNCLKQVASRFGYPSFVAALLRSAEYEKRFGPDLPPGGRPLPDSLTLRDNADDPAIE